MMCFLEILPDEQLPSVLLAADLETRLIVIANDAAKLFSQSDCVFRH